MANCETVEGAGSNGGGGRRGASQGGGLKFTFGLARLAKFAAKGLKVKVPCAAACTVSGTATAYKATARKLGTKKIASGKGKAGKGGTATVTLKPSRSIARKLKKLKSAKVTSSSPCPPAAPSGPPRAR